MSEQRRTERHFADVHGDFIRDHRLRFKDVWNKLQRQIRDGDRSPEVASNAVGFGYHREIDLFSVFLTHGDGSDEVFLSREDFVEELRKHTSGGSYAKT